MAETTQFRAALHGYNREDVVAFIDRMTKEHQEALNRLQEKNNQLRAQLDEANAALAEAGENAEAQMALDEANSLIADLRAQNAEQEERIRSLEEALENGQNGPEAEAETAAAPITQDLDEPIPPVAEVLPVDVAPTKDYTELELAAYRRAELAERLARERADDVYRQMQSVFYQANDKLEGGKADLDQLCQTLTADVKQMLTLLTNLSTNYRSAELSFAEIGEKNRRLLEG